MVGDPACEDFSSKQVSRQDMSFPAYIIDASYLGSDLH